MRACVWDLLLFGSRVIVVVIYVCPAKPKFIRFASVVREEVK